MSNVDIVVVNPLFSFTNVRRAGVLQHSPSLRRPDSLRSGHGGHGLLGQSGRPLQDLSLHGDPLQRSQDHRPQLDEPQVLVHPRPRRGVHGVHGLWQADGVVEGSEERFHQAGEHPVLPVLKRKMCTVQTLLWSKTFRALGLNLEFYLRTYLHGHPPDVLFKVALHHSLTGAANESN